MGSLLLWFSPLLVGPSPTSPECPVPSAVLEEAEQALVDLKIDELPAIQQRLETAWSCSEVARSEDLSRAWLVDAAYLQIRGQKEQATQAWRAAASLSPETWNPRLGGALRGEYEAALQEPAKPEGHLSLYADLPQTLHLYLDGSPQTLPLPIAPGPHLVQVVDRRGNPQAAHFVLLAPAESLQIDLDQFSSPAPRKRARWRLAASGTAAGLAIGSAFLAHAQDQAMQNASDLDTLDQAFTQQKRFAVTSYGLGGLAVTGMTTWLFF